MFHNKLKMDSIAESVKEVMEKSEIDEASVKVPTKTGMIVYGGAKGGSAKAYKDQHGDPYAGEKGPSDKEMEDDEKDEDENEKENEKENKKKVKKEETSFASLLLKSIKENKGNQPQETFTDNNMGEEKMTPAQMKKRERYVLSMKDKTSDFKAKYGKRWKEVMYATATKMAMKEEVEELGESSVTTPDMNPNKVTTDMLRGRETGGKSNTFKPYKLQLKTNGEMKAPDVEEPEDTKEKQKITTNPGPVNVKADAKLTGPIPQSHFAKEKNITRGITAEQVRGMLKNIRSKEKELRRKDIKDFKDKVQSEQVEYYEINEEKPEHTHIAHFEDKDGNWMAKLLINAEHDGHAIDQANAASGKGPFGGLSVRKVERVQKVMEDVEIDEAMDTRADIPAAIRKKRGDPSLTPSEVKSPKRDTISAPGRVGKKQNEEADEKSWKKETDWKPAKGNIKDKAGAIHTPMSRAKDLARSAMKKIKSETMMGKAGATSESVETINESKLLDLYLKSIGMDPARVPRDKKIGYANSSQFERWKLTHQ